MTMLKITSLIYMALWTIPATAFIMTTTTTTTKAIKLSTQLSVTRDEYLQPHFETIVSEDAALDVDRMVECASSSDRLCDVEEMTSMVRDLEGLDNQFHDRANRERDEILKQALILQVELERTRREMVRLGMRLNDDGGDGDDDDVPSRDFGSFDHHVDYRSMAEYESH